MVAERENERLTEEIRKYLKRKLRKVAIILQAIFKDINFARRSYSITDPHGKNCKPTISFKPGFHELYPSFIYFTFLFCYVCQVLLWRSCVYLGYIKFTLSRCGTVFLILLVNSACIFNSSFIF